MEGHPYLMKGIPKALWKEFQLACIFYDTTAKDHFISCMQSMVIRYHRQMQEMQTGPVYNLNRRKKE